MPKSAQVTASYMVPAPVWKSSYRLILGGERASRCSKAGPSWTTPPARIGPRCGCRWFRAGRFPLSASFMRRAMWQARRGIAGGRRGAAGAARGDTKRRWTTCQRRQGRVAEQARPAAAAQGRRRMAAAVPAAASAPPRQWTATRPIDWQLAPPPPHGAPVPSSPELPPTRVGRAVRIPHCAAGHHPQERIGHAAVPATGLDARKLLIYSDHCSRASHQRRRADQFDRQDAGWRPHHRVRWRRLRRRSADGDAQGRRQAAHQLRGRPGHAHHHGVRQQAGRGARNSREPRRPHHQVRHRRDRAPTPRATWIRRPRR